MIRDEIYIRRYDWSAVIFYAADRCDTDEIASELEGIGCHGENLERALGNMGAGEKNTGLTYSDMTRHNSVVVVGVASSPDEYANSIAHESMHLAMHIAHTFGIDSYGEEICYLAGDIAKAINPIAKLLMDGCRCSRGRIMAMKNRNYLKT